MKVEETAYEYHQILLLGTDGVLRLAYAVPEPDMDAKTFNTQCAWGRREAAVVRRRGAVRCVLENEGSKYLSPHSVPVAGVPAGLLAKLDAEPEGYLYKPKGEHK